MLRPVCCNCHWFSSSFFLALFFFGFFLSGYFSNGFPACHKLSAAKCLLPADIDVDVDGVYAIKILASLLRWELEEYRGV